MIDGTVTLCWATVAIVATVVLIRLISQFIVGHSIRTCQWFRDLDR